MMFHREMGSIKTDRAGGRKRESEWISNYLFLKSKTITALIKYWFNHDRFVFIPAILY